MQNHEPVGNLEFRGHFISVTETYLKVENTILNHRLVVRRLLQLVHDSEAHSAALDDLGETLLEHIILVKLLILEVVVERLKVQTDKVAKVLLPVGGRVGRSLELGKVGVKVGLESNLLGEDLVQVVLDLLDLGGELLGDVGARVEAQGLAGVGVGGRVVEGLFELGLLEGVVDVGAQVALGEEDDEVAAGGDLDAAVGVLFVLVVLHGDVVRGGGGVDLLLAVLAVGADEVVELVLGTLDVSSMTVLIKTALVSTF